MIVSLNSNCFPFITNVNNLDLISSNFNCQIQHWLLWFTCYSFNNYFPDDVTQQQFLQDFPIWKLYTVFIIIYLFMSPLAISLQFFIQHSYARTLSPFCFSFVFNKTSKKREIEQGIYIYTLLLMLFSLSHLLWIVSSAFFFSHHLFFLVHFFSFFCYSFTFLLDTF